MKGTLTYLSLPPPILYVVTIHPYFLFPSLKGQKCQVCLDKKGRKKVFIRLPFAKWKSEHKDDDR